jgi:hypothetical protein
MPSATKKMVLAPVLVYLSILAILTTSASQNVLQILIVIDQKLVSIRNVEILAPAYVDRMLNVTSSTIRLAAIVCQASLEIHKWDAVLHRKV